MPRIETTQRTLYKFDELSDEQKEKAISNLYDINVDHEWYDMTLDEAALLGIKIREFDIGRGSYVKGSLTKDHMDVAEAIIAEHGETCDTYKTARDFITARAGLIADLEDGAEVEDLPEYDDLKDEFEKALLEDYRSILRKEYDYLTSEEAIIDTIKANDYEFTENGDLA